MFGGFQRSYIFDKERPYLRAFLTYGLLNILPRYAAEGCAVPIAVTQKWLSRQTETIRR